MPIRGVIIAVGSALAFASSTQADETQTIASMPVRFEGVLAPGQSMRLSTPGVDSVEPAGIETSREGDELLLRGATAMN